MDIPNYEGAGIYQITIGDAYYIGSSANVKKRLQKHSQAAACGREPVKLQAAFDSGARVHVDILEKLDDNSNMRDLLAAERRAILERSPALNAAPVGKAQDVEAEIEQHERAILEYERRIEEHKRDIERIKKRYLTPLGGVKNGKK